MMTSADTYSAKPSIGKVLSMGLASDKYVNTGNYHPTRKVNPSGIENQALETLAKN
jgi:hypothetical protein